MDAVQTPTPNKPPLEAREIISELLSVRLSYSDIAKRAGGYTRSYIQQVHNGDLPAGKPLCKELHRVWRERFGSAPPPRIVITFKDPELYEFAAGLSMEERRGVFKLAKLMTFWRKH